MENHELTEAEKTVVQQLVLNEIWSFFSKGQQFATQKANARVGVTAAKSGQVYRNPKIFPGVVYTDKTRLPEQKWSLFRSKSPVPTRGNVLVKSFNIIFIIGYFLDISDLFYEIWYDSYDGTYIILDKYASPVSSNFKNLDDAITDFIDIISEENPTVHKSELSSREQQILKNLARRGNMNVEGVVDQDEQIEEAIWVDALLEDTKVTRNLLTQMVNDKVTEYHATRMDSVATKHFWQFWGKFVQIPQKYISRGVWGTLRKIVGRAKTATFIVGFSLKEQINVEIWLVKDNINGRSYFYVFDLTSGEIVAQDIKTIRKAYAEAGKKLLIPTEFLNKID